MIHCATHHILLEYRGIIFVAPFASLAAFRCCWLSFRERVVFFFSYSLSIIWSRVGDSVRRSINRVFGTTGFPIVTVWDWTMRTL